MLEDSKEFSKWNNKFSIIQNWHWTENKELTLFKREMKD